MSTRVRLEAGGLSRSGARVVPPASETTDSFGLPDERDLAGMASGCVRDAEVVRDKTAFALLLRSRGGGETGDEVVFPSRTEFPNEGLLLDTTAVMLSSNALTSDGTGIWCTVDTAGQSAGGIKRLSPDSGLRQQPGQPGLVRPACLAGGLVRAH